MWRAKLGSAYTPRSGLINSTHTKPTTSASSTPNGHHAFNPSASAPYRAKGVCQHPGNKGAQQDGAWVLGALRASHEITMSPSMKAP